MGSHCALQYLAPLLFVFQISSQTLSPQEPMTKEYEERKNEKPFGVWARVLVVVVKLCLFVVAMLFLLMVALPKGLWLDVFEP